MADGKGQTAAQKRNDASRHEAFVELHNLSRTHNEEFVVPEIVLVGKLRNPDGILLRWQPFPS